MGGGTMTDKLIENPLREGLVSRATPGTCAIVIFGATGDLTHRKLIPALYNLALERRLPAGSALGGFAPPPRGGGGLPHQSPGGGQRVGRRQFPPVRRPSLRRRYPVRAGLVRGSCRLPGAQADL